MTNENARTAARRTRSPADELDTVGWGLFFVWLGVGLLAEIDVGLGLLGIAAIILGVQGARVGLRLALEGFWIVVGLLFLAGGVWQQFEMQAGLVPILLIVAGLVLLSRLFVPGRLRREPRDASPMSGGPTQPATRRA